MDWHIIMDWLSPPLQILKILVKKDIYKKNIMSASQISCNLCFGEESEDD